MILHRGYIVILVRKETVMKLPKCDNTYTEIPFPQKLSSAAQILLTITLELKMILQNI